MGLWADCRTSFSWRLSNPICRIFIVLSWGFLLIGFQGALQQLIWLDNGSSETSVTDQDEHLSDPWGAGLEASLSNNLSTGTCTEAVARYKINLLPLERLHEEFLAGRATLFLLRIQKAASSALDEMFSTHQNTEECQPNMRVLEWKDGDICNQLFNLLHYGEYDPARCAGMTGWDDPAWRTLDCIPWIFSYAYEESYCQLPELVKGRLRRYFQSSRLVSGHFMYGIHAIGHRGTFAYITTIRHPVSRVVSWWNWSIQMGNQRATLPAYSGFEKFVQDANFSFGGFHKSNHMTRVLCNRGTGIRKSGRKHGSKDLLHENLPLEMLSELTREHYECALRNLQHFAFVFIAESISDVEVLTPLLSRFFNMKSTVGPLNGTESNPTTLDERVGMVARSKLSKAILAKLMDLNKWDALLYDNARTLHENSVAKLIKWSRDGY